MLTDLRLVRPVAGAVLIALIAPLAVFSQEAETPPTPAPVTAAEPPDVPAASNGNAAAAFAAKLAEWKEILKQLRALKTRYDEADEAALPGILQQWNELIARGEIMVSELRQLGAQAYLAAPDQDRELTRFLVKVLEDDMKQDRYEAAAELSQTLLENGCDMPEVFGWGGVAAFCTNNFDRAKQYLTEAQNRGNSSEDVLKYAGLVDEYKGLWEAEQAIRAKEAEADDLPRVKITTNKGDLIVELFENEAPGAVGNFISLAEKGFYNGLTFHRVLPGFMAQGGCPNGTGTGGPGYNIYCECDPAKFPNYRRHFRGTLSMAHAGRDTGGSQFFITFVPTAHLNGGHTAFGRVIEGLDVLSRIQRIDPADKNKPAPDQIVKIEVLRKRNHEYQPNKVE